MTKKNIDTEYQKEIEKSIKMFDVSKPGSTRPASTSRPIIVGHNAAIADPMVKKKKATVTAPKPTEPKKLVVKPKKVVIVHHEDSAPEPEKKQVTKVEIKPLPKPEPAPAEVKAEETSIPAPTEPEVPKSAAVESLIDQVADKKQDEKEMADVAIRMEEVQKSIDSKEFFLPITTAEQERNSRALLAILVLLIGLAAIGFIVGPGRDQINSLLNL